MNRALGKLVLAVALLVSAALLPQAALSLTCCQNCQNKLVTCYNGCGGNATCQAGCDANYENCARRCPGCPF